MEIHENSIGRKIIGTSLEAESWIIGSALADDTKESLLKFVRRFPNLSFVKWEKFNNPFGPVWLQSIRNVLDNIQYDAPLWVQFNKSDAFYEIHETAPNEIWYHRFLDISPTSEYESVFAGEDELLFIGHWQEADYFMAIKTGNSNDQRVYAINYEDIEQSNDEGTGRVSPDSMRIAFDSYAEMFECTIAIRIGTEVFPALTSD